MSRSDEVIMTQWNDDPRLRSNMVKLPSIMPRKTLLTLKPLVRDTYKIYESRVLKCKKETHLNVSDMIIARSNLTH